MSQTKRLPDQLKEEGLSMLNFTEDWQMITRTKDFATQTKGV
jgi:hypothetical protein